MNLRETSDVLRQAINELAEENFRQQVDREKASIRACMGLPWYRRLLNRLPFTITWKTK